MSPWVVECRVGNVLVGRSEQHSFAFGAGSEPWRSGDLMEGVPEDVEIVEWASVWQSGDTLDSLLMRLETTRSSACYLRLPEGEVQYAGTYAAQATATNVSVQNINKRVMGLIGRGPELSVVKTSPTMMSAAARTAVLSTPKSVTCPYIVHYLSGSGQTKPTILAGFTADGTDQTPFGVLSGDSVGNLSSNSGVSSPLPYRGFALWGAQPGSLIQNVRTRGFGYSLMNRPPHENAPFDLNRPDNITMRRVEVDGRLAASVDPARRRSSGGIMPNSGGITIRDVYLHHTRNSGFAVNIRDNSSADIFDINNLQCHDVSNGGADGFAHEEAEFPGLNLEEVMSNVSLRNSRFTTSSAMEHVAWSVPYKSSASGNPAIALPGRVVLDIRAFRTGSTSYNGCLRLKVIRQPNSSGISPVWTYLNTNGVSAASNLITVIGPGGALTPVNLSAYNSAVHSPSTHYIIDLGG